VGPHVIQDVDPCADEVARRIATGRSKPDSPASEGHLHVFEQLGRFHKVRQEVLPHQVENLA